MIRKILVTGGAGFIGSCFVRRLLAGGGCEVVVLDKLTYAGSLDSLGDEVDGKRLVFVQGGIEDGVLVRGVLETYRPVAIVNFAAESHVDRSIDRPADFVMTNVVGTVELLEEAKRVWLTLDAAAQRAFRFLHVSTDEVYGSLGEAGMFTEDSAYAPNSPYSASKAASDHFVRAYHQTYGLPVLTTHCSNNFGPFQFPEKLIPLMILNAMQGKKLPVYGDGLHVRDWLYVEDTCEALQLVLEAGCPGGVYNIGGRTERTNLQVVQAICAAVDLVLPPTEQKSAAERIEFVQDRPGHDRRYALDCSKIERELGWTPKFDFDVALRATVEWYRDHLDWAEEMRSRLG